MPGILPALVQAPAPISDGALQFSQLVLFSAAGNLTAVTPASQSTALQLTALYNRITTCSASGAGVALPADAIGAELTVVNATPNPLTVYPVNGGNDQINGLSSTTGLIVPGNSTAAFMCEQTNTWDATIAMSKQAPLNAGSTLTLTAALNNSTIMLNQATGSVVTLPAATGSGIRFRFVTKTALTSNFHKILAASSSDFIIGACTNVLTSSGACLGYTSPASTNHSIREQGGTGGTAVGEWWELEDIAPNLWEAFGTVFANTTQATPFNSATT